MGWRDLEAFSFGDGGPALADELAALVLDGRKHATCWSASVGMSTEVGKRMVMLDGAGRPRAVLTTMELTLRCFDEVDAAFASDEGEGDQTLFLLAAGALCLLRPPRPVCGRHAALM